MSTDTHFDAWLGREEPRQDRIAPFPTTPGAAPRGRQLEPSAPLLGLPRSF